MKQGFLTIIKFFAFLLLLPVIAATVAAFQIQILSLPVAKEQWFLWGMVVFVLIYLFLYNFKEVYEFGQNIVDGLLKFAGPLAAMAGLVIPIYTGLVICAGLILNILGLASQYQGWLVFALAFTLAMHVVLTAHQLFESDSTPVKGEYLFAFGLAFIVSMWLTSLLLGLALPEFSLADFFKIMFHDAGATYHKIYKALI